MQLDYDISVANQDKKTFGLLTICENKIDDNETNLKDLVAKLNEEKCIRKTSAAKEIYYQTENRSYYSLYDIYIEPQVLEYFNQRIKDTLCTYENSGEIYYSCVMYPDDGANAESLIQKSKKNLKEVNYG